MLAKSVKGLSSSDRASMLAKSSFTEADFARKSDAQLAAFARSLDVAQQERLVANAKFSAKDVSYWNDAMLAKSMKDLNSSDRAAMFAKSGFNETDFQRKNNLQKAAMADVLGAKAFERSILQARSFNYLNAAQMQNVWRSLGRAGQEAALLNAGFEADLARGDSMQRYEHFNRFMADRSAGMR